MKVNAITAFAVVFLWAAVAAPGQSLDISWSSLDGGAGLFATGGTFELSGTVGESGAGVLTGGPFRMVGGFLNEISTIPCDGDLDGDRLVRLQDLTIFLSAFGTCSGEANFNVSADLNGSGCTSLADLTILLANFGETCLD